MHVHLVWCYTNTAWNSSSSTSANIFSQIPFLAQQSHVTTSSGIQQTKADHSVTDILMIFAFIPFQMVLHSCCSTNAISFRIACRHNKTDMRTSWIRTTNASKTLKHQFTYKTTNKNELDFLSLITSS